MLNEYASALKNYAVFNGCATRKEYWMFVLYNLIISIVVVVADETFLGTKGVIYNIYSLALFLPSIAVGVRRLHDTGRTGWWLLVPIANLVFLCQPSVDPVDGERGKLPVIAKIAIAFFALIPVIGIVAAITLPAYQDYTIKAKVTEAYYVGSQAEKSVEIYMSKYGHAPSELNQTEFNASSEFISRISVNPENGEIKLSLNFKPIIGKEITLTPSGSTGNITWKCSGEGIRSPYLPINCR